MTEHADIPAGAPPRCGFRWMAQHSQVTAYVLFALGAVALLLPVTCGWFWGWNWPFLWWGGVTAVILVIAAIWELLHVPGDEAAEVLHARLTVLAVGGLFGLVTALLGVFLSGLWWTEYILPWLRPDGEGKEAWRLMLAALALFGGLAVMFASLQLSRGQERTNPLLRRLLYGYNAVLTGLLLLFVLTVLNLLAYVRLSHALDFTASSIYTLSSRSVNILENLDKPVTVYVLLEPGSTLYTEVQTLLDNCRQYSQRIQVKTISLDLSRAEAVELQKKHPNLEPGLLVVYGTEPEVGSKLIKQSELYVHDFSRRPGERESFKFKGEDLLMGALAELSEGGAKPIIYATQGNGEYDLNDTTTSRPNQGLGIFKERLEKRNYEVKPLTFLPGQSKIPDDAAIVLIAGITRPLPDDAVKALREYLNPSDPNKKKGKLFLLTGLTLGPDGNPVSTGLEELLSGYGVQLKNERIFSIPTPGSFIRSPSMCAAQVNQTLRNPIAEAFRDRVFALFRARPVQASSPVGASASSYVAETLLEVPGFESRPFNQLVFTDTNFRRDAFEAAQEVSLLLRDNPDEFKRRISSQAISVGVIVSESKTDPNDPHAFMRRGTSQRPLLAVFGDAAMVTNQLMSAEGGYYYFDLLASTLDWLRERTGSIGIQPKDRTFFVVEPTVPYWKTVLIPPALVLLGIVGLGAGVWIVRRR
ncbi:MAG: Gldg family protein [Gemmataceae bacterium]|nr:Gldg family protein [Gemmataceae bacterium]MDW8265295.1 Gldg family protein [Gemmataceae bacterium]